MRRGSTSEGGCSRRNGLLQIRGRLGRLHFHDQVLFVHLIVHATIAPSPYQDSLRRDGGLGTGYEISLSLPWARTDACIQGVHKRSRDSEYILGN